MTLAIRPATPDDAEAIRAIYAPAVTVSAASFEVEVPSREAMAQRISATRATHPYLVAEREGAPVGFAYAALHRTRAAYARATETTVYVAASAQREGVGRALYGALLPALAARGFHLAIAGITLPNAASVALHEAFGFTLAGVFTEVGHKFGAYHDVGYWQRILDAAPDPGGGAAA